MYFAWAILHQFSSFSISFLAFTSLYIFLLNISSPYLICYLFSSFLFLPSSLVLLLQFFPRVSKHNFCQLSIFFSPRVIKWKMMPLLYLLCWHRLFWYKLRFPFSFSFLVSRFFEYKYNFSLDFVINNAKRYQRTCEA